MDLGLSGRVAITTASSKGLGKAIARELASEGARVVISSRDEANLRKTAHEISSATANPVVPVVADVTRADDVQRLVEETLRRFGTVDILVTNAGGPPPGAFEAHDDAAWEKAFHLTLLSCVRLIRAVLPAMKAQKWGRIINVTGTSARQPMDDLILSNAYRAAVVNLAKTLSRSLAEYDITVNNVAAGTILTERMQEIAESRAQSSATDAQQTLAQFARSVPLGRLGRPEEFAAAVAFLASERASYITGVTLPVDGGLLRAAW
jgi:3-oxoacyl-[acyl-carrier protein] reductase